MAHFKKLPQKKEGKILYGDKIVDEIVSYAVSEIPYTQLYSKTHLKTINTKGVKSVLNKDSVSIDITVKIHYTQSISEMAFRIQESVRHNVESMTEYHVSCVNVIVKGLLFDEIKQKNTSNGEQSTEQSTNAEIVENSVSENNKNI